MTVQSVQFRPAPASKVNYAATMAKADPAPKADIGAMLANYSSDVNCGFCGGTTSSSSTSIS